MRFDGEDHKIFVLTLNFLLRGIGINPMKHGATLTHWIQEDPHHRGLMWLGHLP